MGADNEGVAVVEFEFQHLLRHIESESNSSSSVRREGVSNAGEVLNHAGWDLRWGLAGLEPSTLRLTATNFILPNLAGTGANRRKSASCDKPGHVASSFFIHLLFANCRYLRQLV